MFVPLVENGYIERNCEVTRLIAKEYLSSLSAFDPDVIILGCTHYPLLKDIIADVANELFSHPVTLIDSGLEAACALKEELIRKDSLSESESAGNIKYFVSDEVHDFMSTASRFLGEELGDVCRASTDVMKF
jgi:glutamate racemase